MKKKFLQAFLSITTVCCLSACDGNPAEVISSESNSSYLEENSCSDDSSCTEGTDSGISSEDSDGSGEDEMPVHTHDLIHTNYQASTCTEDGNIEFWYCSDCRSYFSDAMARNEITYSDVIIPAIGHDMTYTAYKEATCIDNGNVEYWYCSNCDKYFSDGDATEEITDIVIPATGEHVYGDDGACIYCGSHTSTEGLAYTYDSSTESYIVSGIGTATDTEIYIPSTYDNGTDGSHLVATIGSKAFQNNTTITSVKIPSSVTKIETYAFNQCTSLESATIGNSVTTIEDYAFRCCSSLTEIVIPDSVTSIGKAAFYNCTSLERATIGDSVTTIEESAFYGDTALKSINIPDSVTTIGIYLFKSCSALETVSIGNGLTQIGESTFYQCKALADVTIGNSVTSIGKSSFRSCTSLVNVTIPASVSYISQYAFRDCSALACATFEATDGWYIASSSTAKSGTDINVTDASVNAERLSSSSYYSYYWFRNVEEQE